MAARQASLPPVSSPRQPNSLLRAMAVQGQQLLPCSLQMVGSSCVLAGGVQEGGEGHLGSGQQAVLFAFENFARRMMHQFPTNPTAQVCLGLMLRRRACHDGTSPVPQALRRQIEKVCRVLQNGLGASWLNVLSAVPVTLQPP